ncbi:MAG TPA: amidohydrolase family protein [Chthonomonadaceae bacterium]|nr:amidohydrolase family protein [Chthonomonadaceae bacterium]
MDIIDVNTLFGPLPAASVDLAVDALLALMQHHQVKAACTLSTLGLLLDPAIGNAATRAACSEHPELLPVATVNPTMFFGDTAPLERLQTEGFRMVRFFPALQGWPLSYEPFRVLLDSLKGSALPVMVNVAQPGDITALLRDLSGYPGAVILEGVDMTLLAEALAALRKNENWHVEISRLLSPGSIKLAADNAGAGRLLFGTGAPAQATGSALNTLRYAGLAQDALEKILATNARRILKLGN